MRAGDQKARRSGRELLEEKAWDPALRCVQCGYCLPVCPTYQSMGKESASPRGRINLVKLAAEGKTDVIRDLAEPIDLCLGCRACETACPVRVPYGQILEAAKEAVAEERKGAPSPLGERMKEMLLRHLIPHPGRLRLAGAMLWLFQKTGLQSLVLSSGLLRRWSVAADQLGKVLPRVEAPSSRLRRGALLPAQGRKKGRAAFFAGCIMDEVFHGINRSTVALLQQAGWEVIIPGNQRCCGALHAHQGMREKAKQLAKDNIRAFEASGAEIYVNNAGGCGAMLQEYDLLFRDEPEWRERAARFVERTRDISEVLVRCGLPPFRREWEGVIVYQDSCHLRHVQKVVEEPRGLLRSIPGAVYVEMEGADRCCGSGGIYNLLHFEESMKILEDKMKEVEKAGATTIVTTNPGCHLQMRLGVERMGWTDRIRVRHLVEVLAEVCLEQKILTSVKRS
ncbi:glycolate oxidase iron-sulfur subunit [Planifilum fimeticola]|uniref:Glycolate oxidase iron-sulfur subunit n=1 Tax=Planifilum fimeticola TaxID=201975 RepID=A0A2T0LER7_9BACL|nr:(Fe-S)-binding protein [Planifilum fimeticola]PRX40609.1 glycolate oxidase iron-sulfur subunit [Planifilum fimeticola]